MGCRFCRTGRLGFRRNLTRRGRIDVNLIRWNRVEEATFAAARGQLGETGA